MRDYCKALKGINYSEWIKLKTAVDRDFQIRISEKSNSIQFTDSVELKSLFSHNLDKYRVYPVLFALIINIDIIKSVKTVFYFWISFHRSIDRSAFFPPKCKGMGTGLQGGSGETYTW